MATTFDFVVACREADSGQARGVLRECHALIAELESELTEFRAESPVHRLNESLPVTRIPLSPAGIELLERSAALSRQTAGAFDCTAKSRNCPLAIRDRLGWDAATREAWRNHASVHLGFGAIGKGYALDRARLLLESRGFTDFLLNAGGSSVVLSGYAGPGGEAWSWGWSWKRDEQGGNLGLVLSHDSGIPLAIGVSGTHEKGRHLLRSEDGSSVSGNDLPRSALVAVRSAADADALSTALFVSGWDRGLEVMSGLPTADPALALIEADETPVWNGIFENFFKLGARLSALLLIAGTASAQEMIDLGAMIEDSFLPYVLERDWMWMLLPAAMIGMVLLHLKKYRPARARKAKTQFHDF